MTPHSHTQDNPNYGQVLRGYLRLHQLEVEGRDESVDADSVRDSLDVPWRALSADERERVQGLSTDLFSISKPPAGLEEYSPQAQENLLAAVEAKQRGEWTRALSLLRQWGKHITPVLLSYMRGRIWVDAGYPEVGAVFYGHATHLEPDNANYTALFLHSLAKHDQQRALTMANKILEASGELSLALVVHAVSVKFNATREMAEPDAAVVFRSLIPVLSRALTHRYENGGQPNYLLGIVLLANCHEFLGETGAAITYYSRGLQIEPSNHSLLTGRGILTYGKSPQSQKDLERAVELGSPLVWPYLFLAHYYLLHDRYEECRQACERGLGVSAPRTIHSRLSEWLAIAEAELRFPAERVRSWFEQALRLDHSNGTARSNLAYFEQVNPHPSIQRSWVKETENTIRLIGQAERRATLSLAV